MAMILCKECCRRFSDSASRCPHCGKAHTNSAAVLGVVLGVIVLAIVIAACMLGTMGL
jgi:RNA polymerase subunit RPABC4/transcription elongation factor Spt4